jgi:hypothetical protein
MARRFPDLANHTGSRGAKSRTRSLNLTKTSSPAWNAFFKRDRSFGFLFPLTANQHDAIHLMRDHAACLSNLSHPLRSFGHLPVNSVNEIARG